LLLDGVDIAIVASFLLSILLGYASGLRRIFPGLVVTASNLLSFIAFIKCYREGSEQADTLAKSILLDTNVSFQVARDPPDEPSESSGVIEDDIPKEIHEEEEEEEIV